jgi:hypothetical protein
MLRTVVTTLVANSKRGVQLIQDVRVHIGEALHEVPAALIDPHDIGRKRKCSGSANRGNSTIASNHGLVGHDAPAVHRDKRNIDEAVTCLVDVPARRSWERRCS